MYKTIITIVLAVMIAIAAPAAALDVHLDEHSWGFDSFYDVRTYHESHPKALTMHHRGGWNFSTVFFDNMAPNISQVVYEFSEGLEGNVFKLDMTSPMTYWWIDRTMHDYMMFLGHAGFGSTVSMTAYDLGGTPVQWIHWDGSPMGTTLVREIPKELPAPPIPVIKKNVLLANGKCKLKFMFPFDENFTQIRIRIFEDPAVGTGAEIQYKYPDENSNVIREVLKDGIVVEDKLKAIIPSEFQGREGRIEYRTKIDGYTMRGIQYFKLPVPEVE